MAAAIKMAAVTAEARTMATVAKASVMIALAALAISHFVSRNVVANAIACFVAVAIVFVCVCVSGLRLWMGYCNARDTIL